MLASIGSPANSQITVRSLSSTWKHRPLSIAQHRSSSISTWPDLRSVLLATTSNAASARNHGASSARSTSVR